MKPIYGTIDRQLERSLRADLDNKLNNWGRWFYNDNYKEINRDTGIKKVSPSGQILEFAPDTTVTGWEENTPSPPDEVQAKETHKLIFSSGLTVGQRTEVIRFYAMSDDDQQVISSYENDQGIISRLTIAILDIGDDTSKSKDHAYFATELRKAYVKYRGLLLEKRRSDNQRAKLRERAKDRIISYIKNNS